MTGGYDFLPIALEAIYALDGLHLADGAPRHNDPFDQILLAQAKTSEMLF